MFYISCNLTYNLFLRETNRKCSHYGEIKCHLYRDFSMRLIASWHFRKELFPVTMSPFNGYEIDIKWLKALFTYWSIMTWTKFLKITIFIVRNQGNSKFCITQLIILFIFKISVLWSVIFSLLIWGSMKILFFNKKTEVFSLKKSFSIKFVNQFQISFELQNLRFWIFQVLNVVRNLTLCMLTYFPVSPIFNFFQNIEF